MEPLFDYIASEWESIVAAASVLVALSVFVERLVAIWNGYLDGVQKLDAIKKTCS